MKEIIIILIVFISGTLISYTHLCKNNKHGPNSKNEIQKVYQFNNQKYKFIPELIN